MKKINNYEIEHLKEKIMINKDLIIGFEEKLGSDSEWDQDYLKMNIEYLNNEIKNWQDEINGKKEFGGYY